jgi:hypothetical protein
MKNDFTSVCVMEDPEKAETHQKNKRRGKTIVQEKQREKKKEMDGG